MFSLIRRLLPVILGVILIAVFVWFAGPYFAFADYRPLESQTARLIVIGVVIAAWAASAAYRSLRAKRTSDKLAAAAIKPIANEPARPSADVIQLRERFEEAMATLRGKGRRGRSLYELPWYVIIGAPGSGKTTALANSGLHFPLEEKTGRNALRGVGGTRNCDWWFTEDAVFLDTAGRFFTQDSDTTADSTSWLEFLALLRKYRKRRPVNGVILTISAQELLMPGHVDLDGYIDAARRRLKELNRELKIQLPVYLMVTKCDLVAGFTEHFDDLTQDGRAQVWGVTFPYEQTMSGEAARLFQAEFDALVERLNGRLLARLEEDRDVRRRTRIFGFPQQLASLGDALAQFAHAVFASTRFDQSQTLLRGVYFTSGTQEGMPIDRLLGAIGRRFAVAPDAVAPAGRGKAYFIHHLLKNVIFPESGIAGVNRRMEVQKAAAQLGAYAALLAVTVIGVVVFSVSYARNRGYVEAVGLDVAKLNEARSAAGDNSLDNALPRFDALRAVADSANRYREHAPYSMRWGLFQGSSLGEAAEDAYTRDLDGSLLPHVAARFRQRLVQYAAEPETLYEYLKGYLMLGYPEHMDKDRLTFLAGLEWQAAYSDSGQRDRLARHFQALLDNEDRLRAVRLDESIVAQARSTLQQASKPGLIYRYIRIELGSDPAGALRLDRLAGLGAEKVLRRRSGATLSQPVSSLYSKQTFEKITRNDVNTYVKQFLDEYWVWGDARPTIGAPATLSREVIDLYEQDYIRTWDAIVNDIAAPPLRSLPETKEAIAILSGPTSPLRGLLRVVDDNTYLVKPPDPAAAQQRGVGSAIIDKVLKTGRGVIGVQPTTPPGEQITTHFASIHRLVAAEGGPPPIDGILDRLKQLQQHLQPIGTGVGEKAPGDPQSIQAVGEIATALRREAAPLPPGVAGVVTEAASGALSAVRSSTKGNIEARYQQQVVQECTALVANRYPFSPGGPDLPLQDFAKVFGPSGVYDTFYKTELLDLVDTTGASWRWRADASGAAVGGNTAMLRQFEQAQRIRDMFFSGGGQGPQVRFTLTPTNLDSGATRFVIDLDGTVAEYRHLAPRSVSMTWPGDKKPGNAEMTFEERSGNRPHVVNDGAWAIFKLLGTARRESLSDDSYRLRFEHAGHWAEVTVQAQSVRNPFGSQVLQQFRCS
jgi:type VI secretion system protein ImpL